MGEKEDAEGKVKRLFYYHINFIQGKGFSITEHRLNKQKNVQSRTKSYYDISDFYKNESGKSSLENAAEHFLDDRKNGDVDRERLGEEEQYWLEHQQETIDYCIQDCQLTSRLGSKMTRKSGEIIRRFADRQFCAKVLLFMRGSLQGAP